MSIRKVNLVIGEYYHIYNRGNSKQKIFHDNEDLTDAFIASASSVYALTNESSTCAYKMPLPFPCSMNWLANVMIRASLSRINGSGETQSIFPFS